MDILLNNDGDLEINPQGDIVLTDSVAQKIKIKLQWLLGEWKWNREEGMPYLEHLFLKNPDIDFCESMIREKIFEIEEITDVKNIEIVLDGKMRKAAIFYMALTDYGKIKGKVEI